MKQLNNNTFGRNSWSRHKEKLCFLMNTLKKISRVATVCGCVMSLTLDIYWVELSFINNYKEPQS